VIDDLVTASIPDKSYAEQWDMATLQQSMHDIFAIDVPLSEWAAEEGIGEAEIHERLVKAADERFAKKAADFGPAIMRQIERAVLLQTLDGLWREHLVTLEHLRQVIGFRGYAQRDPLNEYKTESFELFQAMLSRLREAVTAQLMRIEVVQRPPPLVPDEDVGTLQASHVDPSTGENEIGGAEPALWQPPSQARNGRLAAEEIDPKDPSTWGRVGRNEACPCGSGKKYKHCHGRIA
jgi:preprotein translocase subunit SecA